MEKNKKTNVKKTTTKKTNNTNKKVNNTKNKSVKKVQNAKPKKEVKAAAPKKVQNKVAPKKATPKKVTPKQVPKKAAEKVTEKLNKVVAPKIREIKKETVKPKPMPAPEPVKLNRPDDKLEKTMIFDGSQRKNLEEVVNKIGEDKVVLKDKVIKRRPINKYIIWALSALIVITLIGSLGAIKKEQKRIKQNTEPASFERLNAEDYKQTDGSEIRNTARDTHKDTDVEIKYSNLKTITIDEFAVKIAEGEKMLVMISSETCSFSILAETDYNRVLSEEKRLMYRLDITAMTDEENSRLRNIYPYTATPTVLAVKDGSIVSEVEGTQTESEFRNWVRSNN